MSLVAQMKTSWMIINQVEIVNKVKILKETRKLRETSGMISLGKLK